MLYEVITEEQDAVSRHRPAEGREQGARLLGSEVDTPNIVLTTAKISMACPQGP